MIKNLSLNRIAHDLDAVTENKDVSPGMEETKIVLRNMFHSAILVKFSAVFFHFASVLFCSRLFP